MRPRPLALFNFSEAVVGRRPPPDVAFFSLAYLRRIYRDSFRPSQHQPHIIARDLRDEANGFAPLGKFEFRDTTPPQMLAAILQTEHCGFATRVCAFAGPGA